MFRPEVLTYVSMRAQRRHMTTRGAVSFRLHAPEQTRWCSPDLQFGRQRATDKTTTISTRDSYAHPPHALQFQCNSSLRRQNKHRRLPNYTEIFPTWGGPFGPRHTGRLGLLAPARIVRHAGAASRMRCCARMNGVTRSALGYDERDPSERLFRDCRGSTPIWSLWWQPIPSSISSRS
jgi:hypothetical protein